MLVKMMHVMALKICCSDEMPTWLSSVHPKSDKTNSVLLQICYAIPSNASVEGIEIIWQATIDSSRGQLDGRA